ncbi:ABC transporter permease [Frigidibacter sp. MR17.14]|uniref:ABC transporter permease n=1 Tax=Frigidibacter sp. MR17.14 TaxID=3126509 RepID=UPI00301310FF
MFYAPRRTGTLATALSVGELIFHSTVRAIRKGHGNAVYGLLMNVLQTAALLLVFYLLMTMMRMRGSAIRGDYFVYMMTGIATFMAHTKAMSAVAQSGSSTSQMQMHGPMTTAVAIISAALASLYLQVLTMAVLLYGYHVLFAPEPLEFEYPVAAMAMVFLGWLYGIALGLVLLGLRPWSPAATNIIQALYSRASMIASGKMVVANSLSWSMLKFFEWNPLFHIIDQLRGFVFVNYNPFHTNWQYPLIVTPIVMLIGLMGEFYTRRRASLSWSAK